MKDHRPRGGPQPACFSVATCAPTCLSDANLAIPSFITSLLRCVLSDSRKHFLTPRAGKASFIIHCSDLSFIYKPFCLEGFYFHARGTASTLFKQILCLLCSRCFSHDSDIFIMNSKITPLGVLAVGVCKTCRYVLRLGPHRTGSNTSGCPGASARCWYYVDDLAHTGCESDGTPERQGQFLVLHLWHNILDLKKKVSLVFK